MQGLPTINGPATGGQGLPTTAIPTIIAPQLNVQNPLRTQAQAATAANINNPYKLRVFDNAGETLAVASGTSKVHYNTVNFDTANGFSTTNFNYTIPVAGYWVLFAFMITSVTNVNVANQLVPYVYVNGVVTIAGLFLGIPSGGLVSQISVAVADVIQLKQGDVVDIRARPFGSDQSINISGEFTYWSMHLISTT